MTAPDVVALITVALIVISQTITLIGRKKGLIK